MCFAGSSITCDGLLTNWAKRKLWQTDTYKMRTHQSISQSNVDIWCRAVDILVSRQTVTIVCTFLSIWRFPIWHICVFAKKWFRVQESDCVCVRRSSKSWFQAPGVISSATSAGYGMAIKEIPREMVKEIFIFCHLATRCKLRRFVKFYRDICLFLWPNRWIRWERAFRFLSAFHGIYEFTMHISSGLIDWQRFCWCAGK